MGSGLYEQEAREALIPGADIVFTGRSTFVGLHHDGGPAARSSLPFSSTFLMMALISATRMWSSWTDGASCDDPPRTSLAEKELINYLLDHW